MAGKKERVSTGRVTGTTSIKLFSRDEDAGEDAIGSELIRSLKNTNTQQIDDPFKDSYQTNLDEGTNLILKPTFNPYALMRLPNENNVLHQCIDAMVTNIESFGYRLEYIGEDNQQDSKEALREKEKVEAFLNNPNGDYSLIELRERVRRDKETFGYAYYEVGRDQKGDVVMLHHIPAHTMRMTRKDGAPVVVEVNLLRDGKTVKQKVKKYFRRYVQEVNSRKVYFKELGDTRAIDPVNGQVKDALTFDEQATEVYKDYIYSPGDPYGLPRWINQLPSILGSRESEITNLHFFKDNAIPAMAVLVSGGSLTSESIQDIENHIYQSKGKKSINRVMVLEAVGDDEAASVEGTLPSPKLDIKPLAGDRQSDALFQEYDMHNQKKIRSSFRMPPIFIGLSEDMTYAVAEASLVMAEGQVFGPERNKVDDLYNQKFLASSGEPLKYWSFRSNPPRLSNPATILAAINRFEQVGAMTPNVAIGIANELFDLTIPFITDEWGNFPFSMVNKLAGAGMLVGTEKLVRAKPTLEGDVSSDAELTEENLEDIEEKVLQPLKNLVRTINVSNVQRSANKKRIRDR